MAVIITLCTVIFSLFIVFELIPLFLQKKWKESCIYSSILLLAYVTHILNTLGVKIPSPANPIKKIVSFIFGIKD